MNIVHIKSGAEPDPQLGRAQGESDGVCCRGALSRFPKGVSGNPNGKRKGTQNKVTVEAREAASLVVDDPAYRMNLMDRAIAAKLPPQVEVMLWHYAHGVPKQSLDINQKITDVAKMTTEGLRAELQELLARL